MAAPPIVRKRHSWPPVLIKKLRARRTHATFGRLLDVLPDTVRRWEAGLARPDLKNAQRLSDLADKEDFLKDWNPVGSIIIVGDLEQASSEISDAMEESLERTARQILGEQ